MLSFNALTMQKHQKIFLCQRSSSSKNSLLRSFNEKFVKAVRHPVNALKYDCPPKLGIPGMHFMSALLMSVAALVHPGPALAERTCCQVAPLVQTTASTTDQQVNISEMQARARTAALNSTMWISAQARLLQQIIAKLSTEQLVISVATVAALLLMLFRLFHGKQLSKSSTSEIDADAATATTGHDQKSQAQNVSNANADGRKDEMVLEATSKALMASTTLNLNSDSKKKAALLISAPSSAERDKKPAQDGVLRQKQRHPPRVQPTMLTLIALATLTYEGTVKVWSADPSKTPTEPLSPLVPDATNTTATSAIVVSRNGNLSTAPETSSPGPMLGSFYFRPAALGFVSFRTGNEVAASGQQAIHTQIPDFQTLVAEYRSILSSRQGHIPPPVSDEGMEIMQARQPLSAGAENVRVASFKTLIADYKNVVSAIPGKQQAADGKQQAVEGKLEAADGKQQAVEGKLEAAPSPVLTDAVLISSPIMVEEKVQVGDGVQLVQWAQGIVHSNSESLGNKSTETALEAAIAAATSDFATAPPYLSLSGQAHYVQNEV
ncbi:hypothetical protein CEUSTIGMA_g10448.t1 [Chlamydomonas eustigma]|uniref:Uncharacterized protein n=1 Tax=Chlamydomonas eustigma TaxID=1157962 RepID=A0A250XIW0_9CHLO|nr:hypothetical protein CEUSTIGMA_g10448.t1 [Chlamydomonas eustigma]|eukprot:GAX83021.1 hypothetical protein CEUSTIGMA_g10448.t1 [Chlamydomonas eustigma]